MPFQKPSDAFFRVQRDDKPWGHEVLWAWADAYVGKLLHVRAGEALSLQYHERKDETISVLAGRIRLEHGEARASLSGSTRSSVAVESREMGAGDCFRLLPGTLHRLVALEDSDVLEASTPQLGDVVRLDDRYGRAAKP